MLGETRALVLVNQERLVTVPEREIEDRAQRLRGVLPRTGGDAADVPVLHFEQLSRRGEGRVGLGDRNSRRLVLGRRAGARGASSVVMWPTVKTVKTVRPGWAEPTGSEEGRVQG